MPPEIKALLDMFAECNHKLMIAQSAGPIMPEEAAVRDAKIRMRNFRHGLVDAANHFAYAETLDAITMDNLHREIVNYEPSWKP